MKILKKSIAIIICVLGFHSCTQNDNVELQKMCNEDQNSRYAKEINWGILTKQDKEREKRVIQLIKEKKIITGKDYFNSALIFQHSQDSKLQSLSVKHMRKAIELDSTIDKWLLAAAIDRELTNKNLPQIYGTQFTEGDGNNKWEICEMDTTKVTDEERKFYKVETLAEQREKLRRMNLIQLSEYLKNDDSIDKMINFINLEFKLGVKSLYNINEYDISTIGYGLMNSNKLENALRIFKLNIELYPNRSNAFDSYGECLLKLNRKDEAIIAYKKALILNPKNINAINKLKEIK